MTFLRREERQAQHEVRVREMTERILGDSRVLVEHDKRERKARVFLSLHPKKKRKTLLW